MNHKIVFDRKKYCIPLRCRCRVRPQWFYWISNPYRYPYGDYLKNKFPSEQLYGPYTPDFFNNTEEPISRPVSVDTTTNVSSYIPVGDDYIEKKPSITREEF